MQYQRTVNAGLIGLPSFPVIVHPDIIVSISGKYFRFAGDAVDIDFIISVKGIQNCRKHMGTLDIEVVVTGTEP